MKFRFRRAMLVLPLAAVTTIACVPDGKEAKTPIDANARVVAVGIPGAGAVAEVGNFLTGGPIHDRVTTFALFAQPGKILEPKRVFVASTSNFGAPLARPGEAEGAVLSIDPNAAAVDISTVAQFAASGTQASTLGGAVQLYTAQSPAFVNGLSNPNALTKDLPAVSMPLGISINNGNGRPWFANAPTGAAGAGTITVIDPQGYPLIGGPSPTAGGVFTGTQTNRNSSSVGGLTTATLGTAILTKSSDLTGRAVFVAVQADGSVMQVHVQKGVDQLAPPGTITPVTTLNRTTAESTDPKVITREGVVFNWAPTRNVLIADPQANRLVVLDITDDGTMFHATTRYLSSSSFNVPIDIAPTTREVAAGSFASNSTLGVGSDLYVLNRGDNTIVRVGMNGEVQAIRNIIANLTDFRANGIAVSSDGQTIYVTVTTPHSGGALLALPAFGQSPAMAQLFEQAKAAGMTGSFMDFAKFMFSAAFTPEQGVGPLFNQQSCVACHNSPVVGGMGIASGQDIHVVGHLNPDGSFESLINQGGPTVRTHSVAELGVPCGLPVGPTASSNVMSLRNAMSLRGNGLIDDIAAGDILANLALEPTSVRGRVNILEDGRIGKFGWKAQVPTLVEFMGDALRNEMGVTNPVQPDDEINGCGSNKQTPEVDALALQATAMFLNNIDPPAPVSCASLAGAAVFASTGCSSCHTPSLPGPGARTAVRLYSDLLLHDMGSALADQMQQGSAKGNEWRTMPLWSLAERSKFLHDGRARTVTDAISAHGGQGQAARDAYMGLSDADKQTMSLFLNCI